MPPMQSVALLMRKATVSGMWSNNDGMDPNWKPSEMSESEQAYCKWYNSIKETPSLLDAFNQGRTFELERVSVLIKRLYNTLQQHHQMPGYSEVLSEFREWLKKTTGDAGE